MERKFRVRLQKMARLALPLGYRGETFKPFMSACSARLQSAEGSDVSLAMQKLAASCTNLLRALQVFVWDCDDVIQLLETKHIDNALRFDPLDKAQIARCAFTKEVDLHVNAKCCVRIWAVVLCCTYTIQLLADLCLIIVHFVYHAIVCAEHLRLLCSVGLSSLSGLTSKL